MKTSNKGFASMPKDQVAQIASMGGIAVSKNRLYMSQIGRKGGLASAVSRRKKNNEKRIPTGSENHRICVMCNGEGEVENNGPKACPVCGGNGYVQV